MEYVFESDRLIIRPRNLNDLDACLSMDRDEEVTKYIPGPWANPEKHREFVLDRMKAVYPDGLGYWSLFSKKNPNTFLGWVLLLPYPHFGDEVEIGWRLNKAYWGSGYATEAAKVILHHALTLDSVKTIVADIHQDNIASIKVAEKIGLLYSGERTLDSLKLKSYQISRF